jgi:ABC-2 type transport system permease protein
LQAKAVRLANHRIAADPPQILGDLAGGHALFPHRFQSVDAFVGPGHLYPSLISCGAQRLPVGEGCMSDQSQNAIRNQPGEPVFRGVNWGGLQTLYIKEVRRFFKVQLQTVWAPAITTLLYLVIFTVALGGTKREVLGHSFADFIAPGLIIMGMMTNAFANSSFSLLVGKIQGTIVDYLMPPLSVGELLVGMVGGAVTRAVLVGLTIWLAMAFWPGVHVTPVHILPVVWFGFFGSVMLSLVGVLTSIWAEKFDHAAAVQNFAIAPLTLLSGTFYSVDKLAPAFQAISHANPFFYAISGFRYGFLGNADSPVFTGGIVILAIDIALVTLCYALLRSGWKLKA